MSAAHEQRIDNAEARNAAFAAAVRNPATLAYFHAMNAAKAQNYARAHGQAFTIGAYTSTPAANGQPGTGYYDPHNLLASNLAGYEKEMGAWLGGSQMNLTRAIQTGSVGQFASDARAQAESAAKTFQMWGASLLGQSRDTHGVSASARVEARNSYNTLKHEMNQSAKLAALATHALGRSVPATSASTSWMALRQQAAAGSGAYVATVPVNVHIDGATIYSAVAKVALQTNARNTSSALTSSSTSR